MKTDLLPTIAAVALAVMAGAVCAHWLGLDERITMAREATARHGGPLGAPPHTPDPRRASAAPVATTAAPFIAPARSAPTPTATPAALAPGWEDRLLQLVEVVERVHGDNQDLRDQVREANRDLMELQFRVDAQSEKFRPLRTTQPIAPRATPVDDGPGVLPPLDAH